MEFMEKALAVDPHHYPISDSPLHIFLGLIYNMLIRLEKDRPSVTFMKFY